MISFHIQRPVNDWPRTLTRLPDGTPIKAVDNVQLLDEAKRIHPGIKTILRHWYDPGQVFGTTDANVLRDKARAFFQTFVDGTFRQFAHNVDYIEEWNEYNASSHNSQEIAERVAWVDAVSWVWANEYRTQPDYEHIRLVLGNVAIGNDVPLGVARIAAQRGDVLGYHPYIPVRNHQVLPNEWDFYSGRWSVMDATFVQQGFVCEWLFTEIGPVGYNTNPINGAISLNALDGWRHSNVCAGNVESYLSVLEYWLQRTSEWNRTHGNRALGGVLFTTGNLDPWKDFETRQPEIDAITQFMAAWPVNPPSPVPPPPPPTVPRQYSRTIHLLPQNATIDQSKAVLDVAFEKRQSVVWSVDDAFINPDPTQANLTGRTVHVWGEWPGGDEGALRDWVERHYPPYPTVIFHPWSELGGFAFEMLPLVPARITQPFGARPEYYSQFGLPGHEGVDFAADMGQPVYCPAPGIVYLIHRNDDGHNYGVHIRVRFDDEYKAIFAHLSAVNVAVDDIVDTGSILGYAGSTGNSTGPHLHITLKRAGATDAGLTDYPYDVVDPTPYFQHLLGSRK